MQRMVLVLPTFNEAPNLPGLIARIRSVVPEADILVVDDNSPDGTGQIADQLARVDPHVRVLHRTVKEGLGAAYVHGFDVALAAGYDVIGEMDADGSHQPEELPVLLAALDTADVVIGSRYVRGGEVRNWPWHRRALSLSGNLYARTLLGIKIRDVTAGFRLFRRTALESIDLAKVQSTGYVFQIDIVVRSLRAGLRVSEVPIVFVEREHGHSKMTPQVARESLRRVTSWGLRHRLAGIRRAR